jgi:hypothetical protein
MFGLVGWFLLLVSGLVLYRLVRLLRRARFLNWLKRNGKLVRATVTNVRKEMRGEKGSLTEKMWDLVPHYEISAQWVDPKTQQVSSFQRAGRGSLPKRYKPGHPVYVLVDPNDSRRYHMAL